MISQMPTLFLFGPDPPRHANPNNTLGFTGAALGTPAATDMCARVSMRCVTCERVAMDGGLIADFLGLHIFSPPLRILDGGVGADVYQGGEGGAKGGGRQEK